MLYSMYMYEKEQPDFPRFAHFRLGRDFSSKVSVQDK